MENLFFFSPDKISTNLNLSDCANLCSQLCSLNIPVNCELIQDFKFYYLQFTTSHGIIFESEYTTKSNCVHFIREFKYVKSINSSL